MKIKVADLSDVALDYAVAVCQKLPIQFDPMGFKSWKKPGGYWVMDQDSGQAIVGCRQHIGTDYSPSKKYEQGGPVMDMAEVDTYMVERGSPLGWLAEITGTNFKARGATRLIAALRCYVMSVAGDEIEIPNGLFQG